MIIGSPIRPFCLTAGKTPKLLLDRTYRTPSLARALPYINWLSKKGLYGRSNCDRGNSYTLFAGAAFVFDLYRYDSVAISCIARGQHNFVDTINVREVQTSRLAVVDRIQEIDEQRAIGRKIADLAGRAVAGD